MSRIFKILRSIQYRQANRLDLSLFRAVFVLLVMGWGVSSTLVSFSRGSVNLGATMLWWFYPASILLLASLAGRLNRETVGDTTSGYLSLISLTGTTNTQWTMIRFVQNWIGFISVWVVRIPFLCLFYTLGGIRFYELILSEVLLLFLYGAVAARSMVVAHNSDNRKGANWSGIGTIFALEILLNLGRIIVGILTALKIPAPNILRQFADFTNGLSLLHWFMNLVSGGFVAYDLIGHLGLYLAITFFLLEKYRRILYERIGESPEPALESKKEKTKALKKRPPLTRCWDNVLGWQSYVYYAGGHDNTTGRVVLYVLAFMFVLFCAATKMLTPIMVIVLIGSGIVFLNAMNGTSHCLDKELKAKTLGSLVMTPHDGLDLYRGWRSGILWLCIPDHIYALLVAIVMLFVEPVASYIIVCFVITIDLSGPLLMLSGLVPIALKSLGTAFVVLFGLFACVMFGVFIAWASHPAFFPFGFLPIYFLFNSFLLHKFVESWLMITIADQV